MTTSEISQSKEGAEGIIIKQTEGEYSPPLPKEVPKEEIVEALPELKKVKLAKIPLLPAVIRLVCGLPGEFLIWRTEFEGWRLSEQTLADMVEVIQALEIEARPEIQALILLPLAYMERYAEYREWKRKGSPKPEKKVVGATPEKIPEGR